MKDQAAKAAEPDFRNGMPFLGGALWLDLLNTTIFTGPARQDLIETPEGLAAWFAAAKLDPPAETAPVEAIALRETLRGAVDLLHAGKPLPEPILETVNAALSGAVRRLELVREGERFILREVLDPGPAGQIAVIAEDFARFLCEHEPARLKHCANPACTMVFYDRGRNNTRRWCSMGLCGNRDKVARYRARKAG